MRNERDRQDDAASERKMTEHKSESSRCPCLAANIFNHQSSIVNRQSKGFTLIELMIVMAVMGILITIAAPNLKVSLIRAREAVLKEDLFQMREAIDQYYADNGKYPATLGDLINIQDKTRSYLRDIPRDPFTGANDWITVAPEGQDAEGGVFDVHSASPLVAVDGTTYNSW